MTGIFPITRARARKLRAEMTPQERKVWAMLREVNRMLGANFRRQAPIGPFIADFAELGRRLVIEIDGSGHGGARDARRDAWLKGQGFQVLRVWNAEVSDNLDGVMQMVLDAVGPLDDALPPGDVRVGDGLLGDAPPPHPSPTRGEGGALMGAAPLEDQPSPPTPNPSPRGGGESPGASDMRDIGRDAPPSPPVGEGWGGGASLRGKPEGNSP